MEKFTVLRSRAAALPMANIDTDQIIPARYLKTTVRSGLAEALFADWRYNQDGSPRADFPLNYPGSASARILICGPNFGCGSSREHAPWAISAFGFRALISPSFADIFRSNALKNGLLTVVVDMRIQEKMAEICKNDPEAEFTIDLEKLKVVLPDGEEIPFELDPFARECLLMGVDELEYILSFEKEISAYETRMLKETT